MSARSQLTQLTLTVAISVGKDEGRSAQHGQPPGTLQGITQGVESGKMANSGHKKGSMHKALSGPASGSIQCYQKLDAAVHVSIATPLVVCERLRSGLSVATCASAPPITPSVITSLMQLCATPHFCMHHSCKVQCNVQS